MKNTSAISKEKIKEIYSLVILAYFAMDLIQREKERGLRGPFDELFPMIGSNLFDLKDKVEDWAKKARIKEEMLDEIKKEKWDSLLKDLDGSRSYDTDAPIKTLRV